MRAVAEEEDDAEARRLRDGGFCLAPAAAGGMLCSSRAGARSPASSPAALLHRCREGRDGGRQGRRGTFPAPGMTAVTHSLLSLVRRRTNWQRREDGGRSLSGNGGKSCCRGRALAPPSTPGVPSAAPRGAYVHTRATARCCHTKDVRVRTSRRVTHAPSAAAMLHAVGRGGRGCIGGWRPFLCSDT